MRLTTTAATSSTTTTIASTTAATTTVCLRLLLLLLSLPSSSPSSSSPPPSFLRFLRRVRWGPLPVVPPLLPLPVPLPVPLLAAMGARAGGGLQPEAREPGEVELQLVARVQQLDQELAAPEALALQVRRLRLDVLLTAAAVRVAALGWETQQHKTGVR